MEDYKTLLLRNGSLFLDKPPIAQNEWVRAHIYPNEWVRAHKIFWTGADIRKATLISYTFKFGDYEYDVDIRPKDKKSVFRKALIDRKIGNINDLEICLNTIKEKNNANRKLRFFGIEGTFGEFKEYFEVYSISLADIFVKN